MGSQILSLNHSFWLFLFSAFLLCEIPAENTTSPASSTLEMQTILGGASPHYPPLFIRIMPTHPISSSSPALVSSQSPRPRQTLGWDLSLSPTPGFAGGWLAGQDSGRSGL